MRFLSVIDYLVDQAILCSLLGGHEVIPFSSRRSITSSGLPVLSASMSVHPLLDNCTDPLEMDRHIGDLSLSTAQRAGGS